jgi:hypothetical protein
MFQDVKRQIAMVCVVSLLGTTLMIVRHERKGPRRAQCV